MNKDEAIRIAQSALRLKHNVTHNNAGVWTWKRYGWIIIMNDDGSVIRAIDEWNILTVDPVD